MSDRVIAVDPSGDAGFSTQRLPFTDTADQADSYLEAMDGHSFGSAAAATLATRYPERIASLSLFDPVIVVKPLPGPVYLWSTALLLRLPQPLRDRAFADIGGTTVDAVHDEGGGQ